MKKTEIYIIGGFLGSGKSTLLQRLLQAQKQNNKKVAVLMNELGDYSVDTKLLDDEIPLRELLNGCICCTMRDELEVQILSLYQAEQPDVIFIETTGAAHPVEVLDACLSPILAPFIAFCKIISMVDAKRWQNRDRYSLPIVNLMEEQVKYADLIIVNKIDLIDQQQKELIHMELCELNKKAPKLYTVFAEMNVNDLLVPESRLQENSSKLHVHYHLQIQSFSYTFNRPIVKKHFEKWLNDLPDSILRIKGFVTFEEHTEKTILFQYAYGVPLYLEQYVSFPNTLVIIGEQLDIEQMKKKLSEMEQSAKLKNVSRNGSR